MKYGEIYPLSNFNPSITSNSSSKVFPSLTVITPSFPTCNRINVENIKLICLIIKIQHNYYLKTGEFTFSMAEEMSCPILVSPLAEIVATCAISSADCTFFDNVLKCDFTVSTAIITPDN